MNHKLGVDVLIKVLEAAEVVGVRVGDDGQPDALSLVDEPDAIQSTRTGPALRASIVDEEVPTGDSSDRAEPRTHVRHVDKHSVGIYFEICVLGGGRQRRQQQHKYCEPSMRRDSLEDHPSFPLLCAAVLGHVRPGGR
ncbi:MAG: hypothetical protein GY937_14275 [bacterium]|nr:hypothetical protein [bacterium]